LGAVALLAAVAAGCSGDKAPGSADSVDSTPPAAEPPKPVTLKFYSWSTFTEATFKTLIADPVSKKYPHITMQFVPRTNTMMPEHLAVSGSTVDILSHATNVMGRFREVGLLEDMTPLLQKQQIKLDRFLPESLVPIREKSEGGLMALPYGINYGGMAYNKDIFDRFGVPYPKDGMLFEDIVELSKRLSRVDGGVEYYGFDASNVAGLSAPLSLNAVNPKTEKAELGIPGWTTVFDLAKRINDQSVAPLKLTSLAPQIDRFVKTRNVAMLQLSGGGLSSFFALARENKDFNWDLVQSPSFKERPNTGAPVTVNPMFSVASNSAHKDEAIRAIDWLTSAESQGVLASSCGFPTVKDESAQKLFCADYTELKGKNLAAVFKNKPAPSSAPTDYEADATGVINKMFSEQVLTGAKDMNTFIRDSSEEINKIINTKKGQ
jgi:multiple sugar transport system substrate-binding protein